MRKRLVAATIAAAALLAFAAPFANAGPGSAACLAAHRLYESTTGKDAPWECLY